MAHPQCNLAREYLDHLWTCSCTLPSFNHKETHQLLVDALRTNLLQALKSTTSLIPLPDNFAHELLDCWNMRPPNNNCLWLTRGLIPSPLANLLHTYFSSNTIIKCLAPLMYDFHFKLYVEIWMCSCAFFHHWKRSL
ncbi:hypothetical protein GLOIN_2v1785823 [Rhizophagus irregularis DAOM 181602=DAOM 197198]|nr:hypothetical protein GLOIN_2v1785823 [Rhizophagus irregularis DAOM 181602=DAOM 197198]